jgi:hypothetical protein
MSTNGNNSRRLRWVKTKNPIRKRLKKKVNEKIFKKKTTDNGSTGGDFQSNEKNTDIDTDTNENHKNNKNSENSENNQNDKNSENNKNKNNRNKKKKRNNKNKIIDPSTSISMNAHNKLNNIDLFEPDEYFIIPKGISHAPFLIPLSGTVKNGTVIVGKVLNKRKIKSESDVKSDIDSDTKTNIGSDTKTNIGSDTKTDIGSDTKTDIDSDTKTDIDSDTKTDIDSDTKTDIDLDINSDNLYEDSKHNKINEGIKKSIDKVINDKAINDKVINDKAINDTAHTTNRMFDLDFLTDIKSGKKFDSSKIKVIRNIEFELIPNQIFDRKPNQIVDRKPNQLIDRKPNQLIDRKPTQLIFRNRKFPSNDFWLNESNYKKEFNTFVLDEKTGAFVEQNIIDPKDFPPLDRRLLSVDNSLRVKKTCEAKKICDDVDDYSSKLVIKGEGMGLLWIKNIHKLILALAFNDKDIVYCEDNTNMIGPDLVIRSTHDWYKPGWTSIDGVGTNPFFDYTCPYICWSGEPLRCPIKDNDNLPICELNTCKKNENNTKDVPPNSEKLHKNTIWWGERRYYYDMVTDIHWIPFILCLDADLSDPIVRKTTNLDKLYDFVYIGSNDKHFLREKLFSILRATHRDKTMVRAYGICQNTENGKKHPKDTGNWNDNYKIYQDFKFTFAIENSLNPGYITEKIYLAFQANSVPIYYGPKEILELFNEKTFYYVNTRLSDEFNPTLPEIENIAKELNSLAENDGPKGWKKYLRHPVFKNNIVPDLFKCDRDSKWINEIAQNVRKNYDSQIKSRDEKNKNKNKENLSIYLS